MTAIAWPSAIISPRAAHADRGTNFKGNTKWLRLIKHRPLLIETFSTQPTESIIRSRRLYAAGKRSRKSERGRGDSLPLVKPIAVFPRVAIVHHHLRYLALKLVQPPRYACIFRESFDERKNIPFATGNNAARYQSALRNTLRSSRGFYLLLRPIARSGNIGKIENWGPCFCETQRKRHAARYQRAAQLVRTKLNSTRKRDNCLTLKRTIGVMKFSREVKLSNYVTES